MGSQHIGPNKMAMEAGKEFLPKVKEMVDAYLAKLGVDKAKDESAYFKASRYVFRGVVAAAAQRLHEDGADKRFVADQATASWSEAWHLFLDTHPEVKANIEKAANMPKPQKSSGSKVVGGLDKMTCPHCGVEGNVEKNPEEGDEFHFHCKDCDEFFNPEEEVEGEDEDGEESEDGEDEEK